MVPPAPAVFGIQGVEFVILAILVIILLIKGPEHIPQLARALGKARGEFERGKQEFEKEVGKEVSKADDRARLEKAARELDIDPEGMSDDELRSAIAAAVEGDEGPGGAGTGGGTEAGADAEE